MSNAVVTSLLALGGVVVGALVNWLGQVALHSRRVEAERTKRTTTPLALSWHAPHGHAASRETQTRGRVRGRQNSEVWQCEQHLAELAIVAPHKVFSAATKLLVVFHEPGFDAQHFEDMRTAFSLVTRNEIGAARR